MHVQFLYFDVIHFIYEYFACLSICMTHACSVFADIRGHCQVLWHWSMDGCEPPRESWELNLDSLQEQLVFLTFEPSLQRLESRLCNFFKIYFYCILVMCVGVCLCVGVAGVQKRIQNPRELVLQVSCFVRVLRTKLGYFREWPTLVTADPSLNFLFFSLNLEYLKIPLKTQVKYSK